MLPESRLARWVRVVVVPAAHAVNSYVFAPVHAFGRRVYLLMSPIGRPIYSVLKTVTARTWKGTCVVANHTANAVCQTAIICGRIADRLIIVHASFVLRFMWKYVYLLLWLIFVAVPRWIAMQFKRGIHEESYVLDIVPSTDKRNGYFVLRDGQHFEIYLANKSHFQVYCVLSSKFSKKFTFFISVLTSRALVDSVEMGKFVLRPFESTFIQRPVNQQARFTFVSVTITKTTSSHTQLIFQQDKSARPVNAMDVGSVVVAKFVQIHRAHNQNDASDDQSANVPPVAPLYVSGSTVRRSRTNSTTNT
jgi:hypothetical protein